MNDYLFTLRSTIEFQNLIKEIKQHRPVIPVYDCEEDNTERWKANSNILKGYNLCLAHLGETDD